LKAYKESLTPDRDHFKVKLNGIGLHCGKGVMMDQLDKLHGDTYNVTYQIGEDLCKGGNVLISEKVKKRL